MPASPSDNVGCPPMTVSTTAVGCNTDMACLSLSCGVDQAGFEFQDLRRGPAALVGAGGDHAPVAGVESWRRHSRGGTSTTCSDTRNPSTRSRTWSTWPPCGSALHTALMTSRSPNVLRCAVPSALPSHRYSSCAAASFGPGRLDQRLDPPPWRASPHRARTWQARSAPHLRATAPQRRLCCPSGVELRMRRAAWRAVLPVLLEMRLHLPSPGSRTPGSPAVSGMLARCRGSRCAPGPTRPPAGSSAPTAAAPRTDARPATATNTTVDHPTPTAATNPSPIQHRVAALTASHPTGRPFQHVE